VDRREQLQERFGKALADNDAHRVRTAFARATTAALLHVGQVLDVGAGMLADDSARALSLVVRMGGQLASGACTLLDSGNAYAAAALARQFVEMDYLLWTFADNPQDMAGWLHASRNQLSKRFQPSTMRERSNGAFRAAEYRSHCEHGGHPNRSAWFLVSDSPPLDLVRAGWVDLGHHLERAWALLVRACAGVGYESATHHHADAIEQVRSAWHAADVLADRLPPIPTDP
jgi:hypothetical protein